MLTSFLKLLAKVFPSGRPGALARLPTETFEFQVAMRNVRHEVEDGTVDLVKLLAAVESTLNEWDDVYVTAKRALGIKTEGEA